MRNGLLAASLVVTMVATGLIVSAASASADPTPAPVAVTPPPTVTVDEPSLTPQELSDQVKAAGTLRADLMRSGAEVAAASARLEGFATQANALLATLSTARTAEVDAKTVAATQRARLLRLGVEVQAAHDALGQLAVDSYISGGGPMGEFAAIFDALTAPSPSQVTDSLATVNYLIEGRARLVEQVQSLQSQQVTTAARAEAASAKAAASANTAAEARAKLDGVIAQQRAALDVLRVAQAQQVGQAAGLRGTLLRSDDPAARAADKALADALQGQDFIFPIDDGSACGMDRATYPNGHLPAAALCPMYAAPGEGLPRPSAIAFNAMSKAFQEQTGTPLCVTDGYRPFAEQVAVKLQSPGMTATPGKSQHGLGLAVDLCGGVENFGAPAHLWMQRNAPLYGWFHPAWAEPTGSMPEPWHWEFAS